MGGCIRAEQARGEKLVKVDHNALHIDQFIAVTITRLHAFLHAFANPFVLGEKCLGNC